MVEPHDEVEQASERPAPPIDWSREPEARYANGVHLVFTPREFGLTFLDATPVPRHGPRLQAGGDAVDASSTWQYPDLSPYRGKHVVLHPQRGVMFAGDGYAAAAQYVRKNGLLDEAVIHAVLDDLPMLDP